ncbi:hypothetical protein ACS0TY_014547 [Phlomoides rotata]
MTCSFKVVVFLLLLLLLPLTVSTFPHKIPRLSPHNRDALRFRNPNERVRGIRKVGLKTHWYKQTVDHFNYAPESYASFRQRYIVSSKHWGGPNSNTPIFAYLGAEDAIDADLPVIGFPFDIAPYFNSLTVFIEHRFYGKSIPYGMKMKEALENSTTRGYFNSAQAIADYAEILLHIKDKFSAHKSPIIVVGGSYGGMLASWFRLKYPHIALGALASSAPILYFDNITPQNAYYSIVTKDFKDVSQKCVETIRKSWGEIDRVASQRGGLSILSQRFKTCSHLNDSSELKDYFDSLYTLAAQYNNPPVNPAVELLCKGIDEAEKESDVIGRIFAGLVSFTGNRTCYLETKKPSPSLMAWYWQTCSELVIPIGIGENDTMFPASPFVLKTYAQDCKDLYGVPPRPHWITTHYGGHDIKLVLKRFGSNIIFSNGLLDPYSSGG